MDQAKTKTASQFDWKGMALNAGLALLSSLVVGLFVQNRRLGYEVRRKNEVRGKYCERVVRLPVDYFFLQY